MKIKLNTITIVVIAYSLIPLVASTGSHATLAATTAQPVGFADPKFQELWIRTDSLVASGQVQRSFYWGPKPNSGPLMEEYADGAGGKRLVQYFDKSRMEINNPNADRNNPFFVTNGLLTMELITGNMQVGNYKHSYRWPAYIPLGDNTGDAANQVTYASFRGALLASTEGHRVGNPVLDLITSTGPYSFFNSVTTGFPPLGFDKYNIKYAYEETRTKRAIPDVFWTFLNANGPVIQNGVRTTARLNDPYFYATGYPITNAYWAKLTVAGKEVDALLQAYERRMLTYVPSAPEGFKVQMGNIGLHYYDWRYKDAGKPPALLNLCSIKPVLGFGKLYAGDEGIRLQLGCARGAEQRIAITRQTFERGQMLSYPEHKSYSGRSQENVFVLRAGIGGAPQGEAWTFQASAGLPATPQPPNPSGKYVPIGAFAEVWYGKPEVRELELGTVPPETQEGVIQLFDGGLMLYPDFPDRKIYVLYHTAGYAYFSTVLIRRDDPNVVINRWAVYDDTLTP